MRKFDNSEAQIAVIFFFFLTIASIGFYFIVIGGMMDSITVIHNNGTQSGAIPLTQDRQDAMALTQGAFAALPIVAFVLTIITAVIYAMATRYSTV